jgi:hypothetical protein
MADNVTVKIDTRGLDNLLGRLEPTADAILGKGANDIKAEVQRLMRQPKSGREYPRGAKTHRASAPGEAPAIDTGNLINSLYAERRGRLHWEEGETAEYAEELEWGSSARNLAPRPHQAPAYEAKKRGVVDAFKALERLAK